MLRLQQVERLGLGAGRSRGVVLKLQVASARGSGTVTSIYHSGTEQHRHCSRAPVSRGHPAAHGCTVVQDGACPGGVRDTFLTRVWPWRVCLQGRQTLWSDGLHRAPDP